MSPLVGRRIVLGVTGGIAAYKAVEVCRRLMDAGAHVTPVMTKGAEHFIGRQALSALASTNVLGSLWDQDDPIPHTRLGQQADLVLIVPATARVIGAYAAGISSDLLTATLLATRAPVVVCPAMHTEMWEHPAVEENLATLRRRGVHVVEPDEGRLAGGDLGKGRLAAPERIVATVERLLGPGDLAGARLLVSAGGTREPIDAVRVIANRSSGKQGYALAKAAVARGARVTLVSANVSLPDPAGADVVRVGTTEELRKATVEAAASADVVVMAAAPADFRPASVAEQKIKKTDDGTPGPITLVTNPDIAAELGANKLPGQVLVAFAAETHDALENARGKLVRKRADLIVVNEVGPDLVFGQDRNTVTLLGADGFTATHGELPKDDVADMIFDQVATRLEAQVRDARRP